MLHMYWLVRSWRYLNYGFKFLETCFFITHMNITLIRLQSINYCSGPKELVTVSSLSLEIQVLNLEAVIRTITGLRKIMARFWMCLIWLGRGKPDFLSCQKSTKKNRNDPSTNIWLKRQINSGQEEMTNWGIFDV